MRTAYYNASHADKIIYDKENKFFLINSFPPLSPNFGFTVVK